MVGTELKEELGERAPGRIRLGGHQHGKEVGCNMEPQWLRIGRRLRHINNTGPWRVFYSVEYLQRDLGHLCLRMNVKHVERGWQGIHAYQYSLADHGAAALYVWQPRRFHWNLNKQRKKVNQKGLSIARVWPTCSFPQRLQMPLTWNCEYLLYYFAIVHTISNNSNVGMRQDSQYIHFPSSSRIHKLVIHCLAGKTEKNICALLSNP